MDGEYVTQDQLEGYVTLDQFNGNMRELATDLKGELLYRPAEVTVTVDLGFGASCAIVVLCLVVIIGYLLRLFREEW